MAAPLPLAPLAALARVTARLTALSGLATAALVLAPATARAAVGPGCEAGVPCADGDGDGFVTCACPSRAPGQPCDCDDADPRSYPGAPETCDATKDNDCNGVTATACGAKAGCLRGACVPECVPLDDFGCATLSYCIQIPSGPRLCSPSSCTIYGCPAGETCLDADGPAGASACVATCNPGVRCPSGERCRGGGCVDPCAGVVCAEGAACQDGRCVPSCECPGSTACGAGEVCEPASARGSARCVERACAGVACPVGAHCAGGACVGDCEGVVCPPRRVCTTAAADGGPSRGACVDRCSPNPCASPQICDWRSGACIEPAIREGGLQPVPAPDAADEQLFVGGGGGLGCTAGGVAGASAAGAFGSLVTFGLLMARRARRARRPRP